MDEFKRTEIFYTIVDNDYEKFLEELEKIIDIDVVDINGMSLLHFCSEYSRPNFAMHLIENKINIELKDKYGNNALWKATFNSRENYELIILLLENEANPNSKNNANKSPLELALSFGDETLIGLLSEPEFKCYADWEYLAKLFNYTIDEKDQDWTYTTSEPDRIDDYLETYKTLEKIESKFSLMEMIIQAVNDQSDNKLEIYWNELIPLLEMDFEINKYTIYYWCDWANEKLEDCFEISGRMRNYWINRIKGNVL